MSLLRSLGTTEEQQDPPAAAHWVNRFFTHHSYPPSPLPEEWAVQLPLRQLQTPGASSAIITFRVAGAPLPLPSGSLPRLQGAAATTGGSDATVTTGITVLPPLLVLLVPLALAPMPYCHCQHLGSSVPLQPPPALIHPPSDAQIDGFLRCPGVLCRENIFEYGCPTSCKLKGREKGNYIATIYAVLFYFIHFLCIFLTFLFYLKYI